MATTEDEAPALCAWCDSEPARPDDGDGCCSETCAAHLFETEQLFASLAGHEDADRGDYLRDQRKDGGR